MITLAAPTTKRCPDCKANKDGKLFYRLSSSADKLSPRCKDCTKRRLTSRTAKAKPGEQKEERFSVVRNTSRKTGQSSWGVYDNHAAQFPVILVADNLKDALLECDRMNRPTEKLRYTKHGQVGLYDPDKETL